MPEISTRQKQYLSQKKKEKYLIFAARILIFVLFMGLWEVSGRTRMDRLFYFQQSIPDCKNLPHHVQGSVAFFPYCSYADRDSCQFLFCCAPGCGNRSPSLVLSTDFPGSGTLSCGSQQSAEISILVPLLIVWLGANERTIVVAGISVAIFGSILNLYSGFARLIRIN